MTLAATLTSEITTSMDPEMRKFVGRVTVNVPMTAVSIRSRGGMGSLASCITLCVGGGKIR